MTETKSKICAELWEKYEPNLRVICKARMHGCEDDIDDVISDVYLALCNHVSREGSPIYPQAWLYATLRNIINQHYKSKYRRENNVSNLSTDQIELPYEHDFVDDIENNSTLEELNAIIGTLNKTEQILIKYSYFDKHKLKEVAEVLDISETATKQKLYRLRRRLRILLSKE